MTFTKDVTLAPFLPPLDVQHVLIGDWEDEWSLLKMGFAVAEGGGLMGFDLADVTFGAFGVFDVDIEMVPPMPGHDPVFLFTAVEPIFVLPIDDVILLIPAVPEFAALIAAIMPGTGFVPVSSTSLHLPEPSIGTLLLLALAGTAALRRRG